MNSRRRSLVILAGLTALARGARSQPASSTWPSRPLHLVAGGVGSVTDVRARWLGERLGAVFGQPILVENNPAAGGNLAAQHVARAAPDGYTLLLTHQGIATINPHMYANPGFDSLNDFAPVARFGIGMLLLAVPVASPIQSLPDLIARAKAKPGTLNFGSNGNGLPPHLANELFKRMAGIEAVHVPYKGGGELMTGLLGEQVDWAMDGLTTMLPQVRGGKLRALAVTGSQRAPQLPEVPTIAESGVPGYEFIGWAGIAAPARTPAAIVERLNQEINRIATSEEGRRWFFNLGSDPGAVTPAGFATFIRTEYAKWGQVVREAGLKAG